MVQQCQGLPLAISVLGGILKDKNSLREWKMVKKDIGSNLSRGEGIKYGGVRHILGLSYDDLPFRLKQLFLYLGTFKEDKEIESGELYLLWIAEGMIPLDRKTKGEMLMDVAERYLVELAQRSLIQLEPMEEQVWDEQVRNYSLSPWLKFQSCRLHDLIRDLCLSKGKEEDFVKKIDLPVAHNGDAVIGIKARRLAIYMDDDANNLDNIALEQQHTVGQLRSLLFFTATYLFSKKINNLKDFKLVRVLKLDRFNFTKGELSRGIIELIHLRCLSLKDCELEELPTCIGDLRYLETLDIRVITRYKPIIPDVLWKMKHLKHLYLPLYIGEVTKKLRFDGLNELELLWNFDASKCDAIDLMKLTNLQVLDATTNTHKEQEGVMNFVNSNLYHPRYTSLGIYGNYYDLIQLLQCENLNKLTIFGNIRGNYMMPQRYEQPCPSQSLTHIVLDNCNIEVETMVLLGKLPNLKSLRLVRNSFAENEFVCTAKSFPRLTYLFLWDQERLEKWRVDEGAMPNLSVLDIIHCQKLEMLPEGLKFLTSLRELGIWGMPITFNNRVQVMDGVEGQEFHKVRHIPNIRIRSEKFW